MAADTQLQTEIKAEFVYLTPPSSSEEQLRREMLQIEIEKVTQRLHTTFRLLVIEMLDMKLQQENENA